MYTVGQRELPKKRRQILAIFSLEDVCLDSQCLRCLLVLCFVEDRGSASGLCFWSQVRFSCGSDDELEDSSLLHEQSQCEFMWGA